MEPYEVQSDNITKNQKIKKDSSKFQNLETYYFANDDGLKGNIDTSLLDDKSDQDIYLLKRTKKKKSQETILSKLVQRFREQPPQPKNERLKDIENFWWLSSPDDSIKGLFQNCDNSFISSDVNIRSFEKTEASVDEYETNIIQEKAEKLLHLSAAVVSRSKLDTKNTEKPTNHSSNKSIQMLHPHSVRGENLGITGASQKSLRPEDDILYQWRLSRKIENIKTSEKTLLQNNRIKKKSCNINVLNKAVDSSLRCACHANSITSSSKCLFSDLQTIEMLQHQKSGSTVNSLCEQKENHFSYMQKECPNEVCVGSCLCCHCTAHCQRSCQILSCSNMIQQAAEKPFDLSIKSKKKSFCIETSTQTSNLVSSMDKKNDRQTSQVLTNINFTQPSHIQILASTSPLTTSTSFTTSKNISTQTSDRSAKKVHLKKSISNDSALTSSVTPILTNKKPASHPENPTLGCNIPSNCFLSKNSYQKLQDNKFSVISNYSNLEDNEKIKQTVLKNQLDPIIKEVLKAHIFAKSIDDNSMIAEPSLNLKQGYKEKELQQVIQENSNENCNHVDVFSSIPFQELSAMSNNRIPFQQQNLIESSSESEFVDDEILIELRNRRKILKKKLSTADDILSFVNR
ncbi:uncharacterized protein LOC101240170 isoform X5 [Hydra vulgaris]|uniref:Uncharacterized protein LOC101240170 isoform X5 n=1 Tax=Hydra vulgaris TaxID=6087 RepID=A0ABM4B4V1_HYDVU